MAEPRSEIIFLSEKHAHTHLILYVCMYVYIYYTHCSKIELLFVKNSMYILYFVFELMRLTSGQRAVYLGLYFL